MANTQSTTEYRRIKTHEWSIHQKNSPKRTNTQYITIFPRTKRSHTLISPQKFILIHHNLLIHSFHHKKYHSNSSSQSPLPTGRVAFEKLTELDYRGSTYYTIRNLSLWECQGWCREEPECAAASFR